MPKPKLLKKTATLPLRHDGALRIVVVADTHSEPHPKSAEVITAEKPDVILHAGDIGNLKVLDYFAKIAPTSAVRGNIDVRADEVPDTLTIDVGDPDDNDSSSGFGFKILLLHIGVNGPKLRADAVRLAKAERAQLVVCGHSHIPFIGRDRDLLVFNPGSIGPRRFQLPIVFGVIDISRDNGIAMKHVSCETGQRWLPYC